MTTNENIDVIHELVDCFSSSGITDFLPNDMQIATNDVTKLGVMQSTSRQMKTIIVRGIEKLIGNAEKRFLV